MDEQRISYLITQYQQQLITAVEREELSSLLQQADFKPVFQDAFASAMQSYEAEKRFVEKDYSDLIKKILNVDKQDVLSSSSLPIGEGQGGAGAKIFDLPPSPVGEGRGEVGGQGRGVVWFNRWAVAASILIAVAIGSYLILNRKTTVDHPLVITNKTFDVKAPLISRATITLSNGNKVYLDSAANGTLARQGNNNIVKSSNGVISYSPSIGGGRGEAGAKGEVAYNTLSNPRGSQAISLTLTDGTKVWLNSESSLYYPTAFKGKERRVEITGEAYFEVAHDASHPFTVRKGTVSVQVLGTHFNVNAYEDETKLKVTLLEGSVKVLLDATPAGAKRTVVKSTTIKPGQQAVIDGGKEAPGGPGEASQIDVMNGIDVDAVMAWKKGFFSMKNQDFQSVMKQLERWYDITVKYEGTPPMIKFQGEMDRSVNLSHFVKYMQDLHINAKIEGRILIIAGK